MPAEPIRVVIADDATIIRKAISGLLRDCENVKVVGEAADYTNAMAVVAKLKPDALIADMHMPGQLDAPTFKEILGACCLIAMSIWNDEETKLLAESYGALRLIDKTELSGELIPAIKECVARIRSRQQFPM